LNGTITVAVCTLDRASVLAGCLDALDVQSPRPPGIDVLVVDNGSTDDTAAVVAAHASARRVVEPVRGLSHARNAALREARSDLVAFLDDDARPEPGWADALVAAADRWPGAGAIGGPVVLEWLAPRPAWLGPELERWYSGRDLGAAARVLGEGEHPVGANLAVRRGAASDVGGFDPELGRVGASLGSEEEIDLLRRLRSAGWDVGWEPAASVRHLVEPERMRVRWLVRRAWAQGRSDAVVAARQAEPPSRRTRSSVLLRGWPSAIREVVAADHRRSAVVREVMRRCRKIASAA
jgi:glycosyltransferase involved in cell wall biosynthesis